MRENFDAAFDYLMRVEGGLVNDVRDKGGMTKYGISTKAFPNLKIVDITKEQAKEIYRVHYWDACRCDDLPASFDIAVFDTAVNQGVKKAVLTLQRALGVTADGIIGEKTIASCRSSGEQELRNFLLWRLREYSRLDDYKVFGNGWFNRLLKLSGVI